MRRKQKDTNNWERSDLYHFFKVFEEPYYGITMEVDCSEAYRLVKDND
jgi:chloramphenicol O-acetyltransferase type A